MLQADCQFYVTITFIIILIVIISWISSLPFDIVIYHCNKWVMNCTQKETSHLSKLFINIIDIFQRDVLKEYFKNLVPSSPPILQKKNARVKEKHDKSKNSSSPPSPQLHQHINQVSNLLPRDLQRATKPNTHIHTHT